MASDADYATAKTLKMFCAQENLNYINCKEENEGKHLANCIKPMNEVLVCSAAVYVSLYPAPAVIILLHARTTSIPSPLPLLLSSHAPHTTRVRTHAHTQTHTRTHTLTYPSYPLIFASSLCTRTHVRVITTLIMVMQHERSE